MTDGEKRIIVKCPRCGQSNAYDLLKVSYNYQPTCGKCSTLLHKNTNRSNIPNSFSDGFHTIYTFIINLTIMIGLIFFFGARLQHDLENQKMYSVLLFISIAILSISLHEFLHAFTAYIGGDTSVKARGYLELSPINYFSTINSFILPSCLFFYTGIFYPGAAVLFEQDVSKSSLWSSIVYLSGVVGNLLVLLFISHILSSYSEILSYQVKCVISFSALVEIITILFNLIPYPGLDGWGVIEPIFPDILKNISTPLKLLMPIIVVYFVLSKNEFTAGFYDYGLSWINSFNLNIDNIIAGRDMVKVF